MARVGISDSLMSRTLQAIQVLDLVDEEGQPTSTLEGLRLAPETEWKKRLEEWLRSAYAEIFQYVDPADNDAVAIRDAFRGYKPVGQQPRMASLFIGLCGEAGLIPPKTNSEQGRAVYARVRRSTVADRPGSQQRRSRKGSSEATNTTRVMPAPLAGLMESLPSEDEGWTQNRRDLFVQTFQSVLDFCILIREDAENGGDD